MRKPGIQFMDFRFFMMRRWHIALRDYLVYGILSCKRCFARAPDIWEKGFECLVKRKIY
ncbi:hypothetical protein CBFG_05725 [Clostridiales bacterium 1_7_47FAA]|nr:hypothetical protein CBFG_05725 [Clostridiales bacterium 1_7_47FAA]